MKCKGRGQMTLFVGQTPDTQNHTTMKINGQTVWPCQGKFYPTYIIGDTFELSIPSGKLEGKITDWDLSKGTDIIYHFDGEWNGKIDGLLTGASGCAEFSLRPDTYGEVETSIGQNMTWEDLLLVRQLYDYFPKGEDFSPKGKQDRMQKIWDMLSQAKF